jgi:vitamin B12 transporter
MDRRYSLYGIAGLVLVLISAWLLRRCGEGSDASVRAPESRMTFLGPGKAAEPKKNMVPKNAGLTAPTLLNMEELQENIRKYYPEAEHAAGKEGRVTLALIVGADGAVSGVRVETSGGADFDAAAAKAAAAMRFSPAHEGGKPVAVEIDEAIDFQYDKK